jgi:hypothetical protein
MVVGSSPKAIERFIGHRCNDAVPNFAREDGSRVALGLLVSEMIRFLWEAGYPTTYLETKEGQAIASESRHASSPLRYLFSSDELKHDVLPGRIAILCVDAADSVGIGDHGVVWNKETVLDPAGECRDFDDVVIYSAIIVNDLPNG